MLNETECQSSADAYTLREWCRRNGIGLTSAYEEIKAGRLVARKARGRTIVTVEDGAAWRAALPKLETATA